MNSQELLSRFLSETYNETTIVAYTSVLNIPILLAYEKQIGKSLAEFTSDDMFEFFKLCYDSALEKQKTLATGYMNTIGSIYAKFFDWYIDNIELVRNPVNRTLKRRLVEYIESHSLCLLTKEEIEKAIADIPVAVDPDYANYCELIIRLFFEGIQNTRDFLLVKWDAYNPAEKTIKYKGIELHISDRLNELLQLNERETQIYIFRHTLTAARWHNSLIKVFSRDSDVDSRKIESVVTVIDKIYKKYIFDNGFPHNYKQIYYCGLYNYVVEKMGKEEAIAVILSKDRLGDNKTFKSVLQSYGVTFDGGVTACKQNLSLYIDR